MSLLQLSLSPVNMSLALASHGGPLTLSELGGVFPTGRSPASAQRIADLVKDKGILESMQEGAVYAWLQKDTRFKIAEINSMGYIGTPVETALERMTEVTKWSEWVPHVTAVHTEPHQYERDSEKLEPYGKFAESTLRKKRREALVMQYRVKQKEFRVPVQALWGLLAGGAQYIYDSVGMDQESMIHAVNVSFTYVAIPGQSDGCIFCYQTVAQVNLEKTGGRFLFPFMKFFMERDLLHEAHLHIWYAANRAMDPKWQNPSLPLPEKAIPPRASDNPCGLIYNFNRIRR